jgi:hypothetical protein
MISTNHLPIRDTPHNENRKFTFASVWKTAWSPISSLLNKAKLEVNRHKLEQIFRASGNTAVEPDVLIQESSDFGNEITNEMDSAKIDLFQSSQFTSLSAMDQFFIRGVVEGYEKRATKQIYTNLGGYYLDGRQVLLQGAEILKNTFISQLQSTMNNPSKLIDEYRTAATEAGNQVNKMIEGVIANRGFDEDQATRFKDKVQVAFLKSRVSQAAQEGGYISPFSYDVLVRAVQEYHIPEALTDFSPSTRRGVGV